MATRSKTKGVKKVPAPAKATAEEVTYFPLPAGQNPGDPFYGQLDLLDLRDPADYAAALKKLGSAARIIGADALVLHWADWVMKAAPTPSGDRDFVGLSRDLFVRATAALNALDLSEETRQAIDTTITAAFQIGEIKGELRQALHARKDMPRARIEAAQAGRTKNAEARRKMIVEVCATHGRPLNKRGTPRWLIKKRVSVSMLRTLSDDLKIILATTS